MKQAPAGRCHVAPQGHRAKGVSQQWVYICLHAMEKVICSKVKVMLPLGGKLCNVAWAAHCVQHAATGHAPPLPLHGRRRMRARPGMEQR